MFWRQSYNVIYNKNNSNLRGKLASYGVTPEKVELIMSKIKDSELDEDYKIVDQDTHLWMVNEGLWDIFEKSCQDANIILTRWNEPER